MNGLDFLYQSFLGHSLCYNGLSIWTIENEGDRMDEAMKMNRDQLAQRFNACRPALCAIGDETRQLIIRVFIENCGAGGLRVGEIQNSTNISRAAVSHHLKILKDAGIIDVRREGTKNFYYLDAASSSLLAVSELFHHAVELMKHCPTYKERNR